MKTTEEEMLRTLLGVYDGNDELTAEGQFDIFPTYMQGGILTAIFEKLKYEGLVAQYRVSVTGEWCANLTPEAFNYFAKKEGKQSTP
jgi:hypothetical protein